MAMPNKSFESKGEHFSHLLDKLEDEFRWLAQHPNDACEIELNQLNDSIKELSTLAKTVGGKVYKDFVKFQTDFDRACKNFRNIKPGDYQRFDEMIQVLFRDLKKGGK